MRRLLRFSFGNFRSQIQFEDLLDIYHALSRTDVLTIFDRNTHSLFGRDAPNPVVLEPGERSKSWQSAEKIIQTALSLGLGRDSLLLGVGGGMICDLAAFSASVYMRGCRLILVPTSLLAMVDAAIGGKTAINIGGYKNMVGTFYPAEEIRMAIPVLKSLPPREFKAGLAEVIKTAMLGDAGLFKLLETKQPEIMARDNQALEEIVRRSIAVKGRIVEEDFKESGGRAVLNLGHTFAHALEAAGGLETWNHGEAVAWGLAKAVDLGLKLGATDKEYARAVKKILSDYRYQLEVEEDIAVHELIRAMHVDKKKKAGKLRLVIQRRICDTFLEHIEDALILEILNQKRL
ncbi:3-dehydroquinate synthase [subsurface metagenome]